MSNLLDISVKSQKNKKGRTVVVISCESSVFDGSIIIKPFIKLVNGENVGVVFGIFSNTPELEEAYDFFDLIDLPFISNLKELINQTIKAVIDELI